MEISQNFVALSEYMNFKEKIEKIKIVNSVFRAFILFFIQIFEVSKNKIIWISLVSILLDSFTCFFEDFFEVLLKSWYRFDFREKLIYCVLQLNARDLWLVVCNVLSQIYIVDPSFFWINNKITSLPYSDLLFLLFWQFWQFL